MPRKIVGQPSKVAIFIEASLHNANRTKFGLDHFLQKGDVLVVDFRKIYNPAFIANEKPATKGNLIYTMPDSIESAFKLIDKFNPDFVLDFAQLPRVQIETRRRLKKARIPVVVKVDGVLPNPRNLVLKFCGFVMNWLRRPVQRAHAVANDLPVPRAMFTELVLKLILVLMPPNVVLLAGSRSILTRNILSTKKIWIPSSDSAVFENIFFKGGAQPEKDYILYIDENLAESPDWKSMGVNPPVASERYYESIKRLFDRLETMGLPVVVAAHPDRENSKNLEEKFGPRRIQTGQTAKLVCGAKFVLTHQSTAVSFAVLNSVPLVFLTNPEIENSPVGSRVRLMARTLGAPLLDMDVSSTVVDDLGIPLINFRKYQTYRSRYLKSRLCNSSSQWDRLESAIFARGLL